MKDLSPRRLATLDDKVRGSSWSTKEYRKLWDESSLELISLLRKYAPSAVFMGLCSMHRNGRVREIALNELSQIDDGSELPYLLLRSCEWVSINVKKAQLALKNRLKVAYTRHFLFNIALTDQLKQRKRLLATEVFQSINEQCTRAETQEFLDALQHDDHKTRRLCFYLALSARNADRQEILKAGLRNKDNVVRKIALMAASAQTSGEPLWELISRAMRDHFPPHRRDALELVLTHFPDRAVEQLKVGLLDDAAKVRSFARFHLKERVPDFDFVEFYRQALSSGEGSGTAAAIIALAECRQRDDYEFVEKFLASKNKKIKKAAAKALLFLDDNRTVPHLMEFLCSEDRGLSTEARELLKKCDYLLSGEELWRIYSGRNKHTQMNVLKLLVRLPKWESLGYLLLAISNKDPEIRQFALDAVLRWQARHWNNWRFTKPNKNQAERIRLAAPVVASHIAGLKFREIHQVLESL